uniref:Integrase catalytic domain-containing protein n=1 Tax=Photinus pyralis TaxID=7054 RepID=A0A1Y1LQW2_PHOPY
MSKVQLVEELHKPARKNFPRRRVIIKGLNDLFQADLVEMIPYARTNKGFRYILVIINAFSKFVWAFPIKRKNGKMVADTMKKLLLQLVTPPTNLQTDMGKEFYNKDFSEVMKKFKVNHFSSFSNLKSSIVERVNRTLKGMMWKEFSLQGSYKWLGLLPRIVDKYNATIHKTTGYKPIEVNEKNASHILKKSFSRMKVVDPKPPKYKVGDFVRINKYRTVFTKGYTPNWTYEVFTVVKVKVSNPTTYILEDSRKQEIKGRFYEQELQAAKFPDIHLVERVIRRKGQKSFVKWLGFDSSHNSWISNKDLV